VKNIIERHEILTKSIGTRPEEDISYKTCQVLPPLVFVFFFFGSVLEVFFYLLFNYKVHPWKEMMMKDKPSSSKNGITEGIEMEDIAITNADTD